MPGINPGKERENLLPREPEHAGVSLPNGRREDEGRDSAAGGQLVPAVLNEGIPVGLIQTVVPRLAVPLAVGAEGLHRTKAEGGENMTSNEGSSRVGGLVHDMQFIGIHRGIIGHNHLTIKL
jgi:hypothetical protein